MQGTKGAAGYALGHSAREIGRLSTQARVFEPFTRRMLEQAGLSPGMRVLDVGCGAGDVAFLCASLVGDSGEVIGMDKSAAAVRAAEERAMGAGLANVTFTVGDPSETSFATPFDAVVGRLVLMHQADPVAMLSKLSRLLRHGGIIAFQEFDLAGARSLPPSQSYDQSIHWIGAALTATGTDMRMGAKLHSVFIGAGLPAPALSLDAGIWGGTDNPAASLAADTVRSLLPVIEKFGIATAAEVQIDSLQDRIQAELLALDGVAISPSLIGAWTALG